jgi:hypothetical protein
MVDRYFFFEDGRPPFAFAADEERRHWYATTPTAHHIVHFDGEQPTKITVPNSMGSKLISFGQRLGENWLLVEGRGGGAHFYNQNGLHLKSINLGDAINDVQSTADGLIWVSYFDEGIFGGGIGANGLVCFDSDGKDIFRYAELAEKQHLPHVDDCYALNVSPEFTWLSYYSDFPLVELKDLRLTQSWDNFGSFSAFAIRGETVLGLPTRGGKVLEINRDTRVVREFDPIDDSNNRLTDFKGRLYQERFANMDAEWLQYYNPFQATAKGSELYLHTESALFRAPDIFPDGLA